MQRLIAVTLLITLPFWALIAQSPPGSWNDNFSYNSGSFVTASKSRIYCAASGGIIVYDKAFNSLSRLSTASGLSEAGIATIAWSATTTTLVIAYNNTKIDLIVNNQITSLSDIYRKNIPGLKEIYRIRLRGNHAYLATSFGIVVVDLLRNEITDTWKPGSNSGNNPVYDLAFHNETVAAATLNGIYLADIDNPGLVYFGNWQLDTSLPSPNAAYSAIVSTDEGVITAKSSTTGGDTLFISENGVWQYLYSNTGQSVNSLETYAGNQIIVSLGSSVIIINQAGSILKSITEYAGSPAAPSNAIIDETTIWIADRERGMAAIYSSNLSEIFLPDGPQTDNVISITADKSKVLVAGGGVTNPWNNLWRTLQVSWKKDGKWRSLPQSQYRDALRVIEGPNDNIFISTWGMGLLEYKDTILVNHYNENNSPLLSIFPGQSYTRICGLAYDHQGNLWITQSGVDHNIKILKPDRSWITLPITIEAPTIGDIIVSRSGLKWIVLPRGHGIFILDDNNNPSNFQNIKHRKTAIRDTDDKVINMVYNIVEDLEGNIWVGTDQGPAIYYSPDRIITEDIRAVRPKIPRNDGSGLADFALGTETITSIAVDGANRKWIATAGSGAFLLSPDGTETLLHFNAANSPLPSNNITSIDVDMNSGMVWFGTASGIISYRGDAPAGKESFSSLYAFPNPVHHHFEGNLTIAGLVRDTRVKITDVAGNLVFETNSTGSEATWHLKNFRGNRVATGVYLIFCSSSDGTMSAVTKVLIVN